MRYADDAILGFPDNAILGFSGDFRWLSNFAIEHDGLSVEHYYQAAKAVDPKDRDWIMASETPGLAKRRGQTIEIRADWEEIRLSVMLEHTHRKYTQNPFRWMLAATGTREIVEYNHWGDTFWGVTAFGGENHLGRILMQVRSEILEAGVVVP